MPSNRVDILRSSIEDCLRIAWNIGVMVVCPYLGAQSGGPQGRSDIVLDEGARLVGIHIHGRVCGLTVQRLILNCDGVDGHTFGSVGLDVLDEVLRIGADVVVV